MHLLESGHASHGAARFSPERAHWYLFLLGSVFTGLAYPFSRCLQGRGCELQPSGSLSIELHVTKGNALDRHVATMK